MLIDEARDAALEEAARIADNYTVAGVRAGESWSAGQHIAAAIRALKSHPIQPSEREAIVAYIRWKRDNITGQEDRTPWGWLNGIADEIERGDHLPKPIEGERGND